MAAILGPASLLPRCSQFFRLSKYFDRRNYVHSRIMCSHTARKRLNFRIGGTFAPVAALDRCA
jgi:hypothetical protein